MSVYWHGCLTLLNQFMGRDRLTVMDRSTIVSTVGQARKVAQGLQQKDRAGFNIGLGIDMAENPLRTSHVSHDATRSSV